MLEVLPLFHRIAGRPVIVLGDGEAAIAKRRLVERAGGVPCGEEEAGARLAFVALDQPEAAAARLRARGLLVNVVDRPDLCDFTTPALVERGPVVVAVGTGGASAGLAKHLRLRLEALLPQSLGALAQALAAARGALRARWGDAGARRRALDAALGEGGVLDPFTQDAHQRVAGWLAGAAEPSLAGLYHIHLRSDDPEDISLRDARLLGSADGIVHEPGIPPAILARARADAQRQILLPGQAFVPTDGVWVQISRTT